MCVFFFLVNENLKHDMVLVDKLTICYCFDFSSRMQVSHYMLEWENDAWK